MRQREEFFRRRRALLLWLAALIGVVLAISALAAYRLARVASDLDQARDLLQLAGAQVEAGDLAAAATTIDQAGGLLLSATERLNTSPELDLIAAFPGAGDNVDALRSTVALSLQLASGGSQLLDIAEPLQAADGTIEVPLRNGAIPVDAVSQAATTARAVAAELPVAADRPSGNWLVGPVREAQDDVFDEALRRRAQLDVLGRSLELLAALSGESGPRRYLIAVANTAEMRGSGGMYLSYGVLDGLNGDFDLGAFGPIDEIQTGGGVDPVTLEVPDDELNRWSGLEPTRLWRNVNLVPDLRVVGPRAAAMFEAATSLPVDGVIQIDAAGLAAILEGTGPIVVDGLGEINADNVVETTLSRAYFLFPDREERQDVLGDVAEAVFRRLIEGEYDSLRPLATALVRAGAERHVELWTSHAGEARIAASFGVDGATLPAEAGDSLQLTVQNFSRNKLDFYVDTSVVVAGSRPPSDDGALEVTVRVANGAPVGVAEPEEVFGGEFTGSDVAPGVYRGAVSLYVPNGATIGSTDGGPEATTPRLVSEGGRSVVVWDVEVPAGSDAEVVVQLLLPPRAAGPAARLGLVPVPRVRPTSWDIDVDLGDGTFLRRQGPLETLEVVVAEAAP